MSFSDLELYYILVRLEYLKYILKYHLNIFSKITVILSSIILTLYLVLDSVDRMEF